jgi:hypothetical protein
MIRPLIIPLVLIFLTGVACGKADEAVQAVDKVKTLKDDLEKTMQKAAQDIEARADQMTGGPARDKGKSSAEKEEKSDKGEHEEPDED